MSNPTRSRVYRHTQGIDYLGNLPGANRPRDTLDVRVIEGEVTLAESVSVEAVVEALDITDRLDRNLGLVGLVDDTSLTVEQVETAVDVEDRAGRVLGAVEVTGLPDHDRDEVDKESLAADATLELELSAEGADRVLGVVVSSGDYDVTISWRTKSGTEIGTTEVDAAVAGGTETTLDEPALSDFAVVTVTDQSSAEQTVTGVARLA